MIKPDAVAKGSAKQIEKAIVDNGFTILGRAERTLTREEVEKFYAEHKGKEFFDRLCTFMTSGTAPHNPD